MIKKILKKCAALFDLDIVRSGSKQRGSFDSVIAQIASQWQPHTIIDVGAAYGDFVKKTASIFSDASFVLVEPLEEYAESLEAVKKTYPIKAIVSGAASAQHGEMPIHVHADLVGSSLKKEIEGEHVDGVERVVPVTTLDAIEEEQQLTGPYLLKIDVQGAELDVLAGAQNVLKNTECIVLEVSLFRSMHGGADLHDIVTYMKEKGFVAYDIASFLYRPYDNALSQVDMIFVKENGPLRQFLGYATKEQREEQYKK